MSEICTFQFKFRGYAAYTVDASVFQFDQNLDTPYRVSITFDGDIHPARTMSFYTKTIDEAIQMILNMSAIESHQTHFHKPTPSCEDTDYDRLRWKWIE